MRSRHEQDATNQDPLHSRGRQIVRLHVGHVACHHNRRRGSSRHAHCKDQMICEQPHKPRKNTTYATLPSIFGRSQGAKRRLDGVAGSPSPRKPQRYGQSWRHSEGRKLAQPWWEERVPPLSRRELFGASWKGEGPLPLTGVAPQSQPLQGMLLCPSTNICPKELTRDMRGLFNSLLVRVACYPS